MSLPRSRSCCTSGEKAKLQADPNPEAPTASAILFLHQACVAGDAKPLAILKHPGIGKTPEMLIRFAAVRAFRMINAGHNRGSSVHLHFYVLDIHETRPVLRVRKIRQKLP